MIQRATILLFLLAVTTIVSGQTFTNVEPIQEVGSEYKVTSFTLDKDNNKYVGTNAGLVKVSANGTVETLYSEGAVQAIVWHRQEGVWIGIDDNVVYHPATGSKIALEGDDIRINAMALSGSQVWIGTNNGVYVVSTKKKKVIEHFTAENSKLESNQINDIYIDASRLKWIGTDRGIARVDNNKWKIYEKNYQFTAITGNSEGTWIAAGGEMWLVDQYNRWARTGVSDGLSYGPIRALAADQKGKIYILSEILVQFDPYSDVHIEIDNEYTMQGGDDVALLVDMNDKVWVGTLEHGLTAMDLDVSEEQALIAYVTVEHPACNGEASGSLDVDVQGGRTPYNYKWSNAALSGPSLAVLKDGRYLVTITDADGFTYQLEAIVKNPRQMGLTLLVDELTGSIDAIATGGTGGYSYQWSNGATTKSVANLEAGSHELVVTDRSGCEVKAGHVQAALAETAPDTAGAEIATIEPTAVISNDKEEASQESDPDKSTPVASGTTKAGAAAIATGAEPGGSNPEDNQDVSPPVAIVEVAPVAVSATSLEAVDVEVLKTLDATTLAVGQTLRIDQLSFDADSTSINSQSRVVLNEVYTFLKSNDRIVVEIGGHTNGLPEHDYCDRLSSSRAESVAYYLYDKGIDKGRVVYKGYGKREPISTNSTVAGRKKNQRVELKVLEI